MRGELTPRAEILLPAYMPGGLWMKPANGLGSRLARGGVVTTGVGLAPRQRRRDNTTNTMRTTPTTRAKIGSHRMINPSTAVVYGLIILRFEPIRICRTLDIHGRTVGTLPHTCRLCARAGPSVGSPVARRSETFKLLSHAGRLDADQFTPLSKTLRAKPV